MGKSAPKPPNPKETAAASTGTNVSTAIANAWLGNISEIGPDGSTKVDQTGMQQMYDPYTKQTYSIPTFTRTTQLSEQQKLIKDQQDAASLNLATLGNNLSGTLGNQLTGNFQLGNEAVESRLFDLGSKRLDPAFAKQEEALRSRLLNSGIREGSAAWNSEMERSQQGKNDAYNQLLLQGRGQASQELLTEDNQRINQISALLNGGQVSQPNFMGANMPTIPTTDTAGIINQDYQNRLAAFQQKQAGLGGLFSGLGSLGGSLIGLSDDDAKKNKERHGDVEGEMGLWSFNYKDEPPGTPKHVGLMASEVQKTKPAAVKRGKDGLRRVDYGKALGLMGVK
jgi:hypothetical protein